MTLRRRFWMRSSALAGYKLAVSSRGTASKQIQTVPSQTLKLRARLKKFNYIELNVLIYNSIFL
jgi:hypothetical protein